MALRTKKKKSAVADQFRAKADAIRAELLDPEKDLTKDEVEKKMQGIASLEARAAAAAGFTQEEEIADQGGDDEPGVHRIGARSIRGKQQDEDEEEADVLEQRAEKEEEILAFDDQIKELQARAQKYFGKVKDFVIASAKGGRHGLNRNQLKVIEDATILARTITGAEGSAEVLLPLQQVPSIFSLPNILQGVLQGAARYQVSGRTLRIPYVVQTDAADGITRPMAGIANVAIIDEGALKDTREPKYLQRLLTVYKWAAIAKIGDETLGDDFTGQLAPNVTNQVGGQVVNAMNERMTYTGDGTGEPLGALHADNPSLMVVNRTTTQMVKTADIFKMYSRHTHGPKSMWLCSRRVIEQLFALTLNGNTLVTFLANLTGVPPMSLLGYPIHICDILPTLGVQADLALVNPEFYAAAVRTNLTVESSIHVEFVKDITTYRFLARGGGIPIPDGTYAYQASGGVKVDEHSPFTVLGDATTS